jgi:hypothetical protein
MRFVLNAAISVLFRNCGVRPSDKNSNNPLAGEPESEKDAARDFLLPARS